MFWIRTVHSDTPEQVGFVRTGVHAVGAVEHLADFHTPGKQLVTGGLDVGDAQVQALCGARRGPGDVLAKDGGASRTRTCELDSAEIAAVIEIGIEPPTKPA